MLSSTYIFVKSVKVNIFHMNNKRGALCLSQGRGMGYPACYWAMGLKRPVVWDKHRLSGIQVIKDQWSHY